MKKTAIALAVAAFVATPAIAGVQISGNATYEYSKTDTADGFAVKDDDTDFEIVATTELNNGWSGKLAMDLEAGSNSVLEENCSAADVIANATTCPNTATVKTAAKASSAKSLDINSIALSHDTFGTFTFGGGVYLGTTGRYGAAYEGDIELNMDDSISYSNKMGGVSFGVTAEMGDSKETATGLGLEYSTGNLSLGLGMATENGGSIVETEDAAQDLTTGVAGTDVTLSNIGAKYKFNQFTVGGHVETISSEAANGDTTDTTYTGVAVGYALNDATSLSLDAILGGFESSTNATASNADFTDITVGASHKMGAITLAGAYGSTSYEPNGSETRGELDVSAKYDFGNGYFALVSYEDVTNDGGTKGKDSNTTELKVGAKF